MITLGDELPCIRLPLHYKTLRHIAGQCGTSAKRQAFLRREIEIIAANVRQRRLSAYMGTTYLHAIRELI